MPLPLLACSTLSSSTQLQGILCNAGPPAQILLKIRSDACASWHIHPSSISPDTHLSLACLTASVHVQASSPRACLSARRKTVASWAKLVEGSWVPGWGISSARSRVMDSWVCWEVVLVELFWATSCSRLCAFQLLFCASCLAPCQMRQQCGGSELLLLGEEMRRQAVIYELRHGQQCPAACG